MAKKSISPDGVVVQAGNDGSLVIGDGVWTFSTGKPVTDNYMLNSQGVGYGSGAALKITKSEKFYSHDTTGRWYGGAGKTGTAIVSPTAPAESVFPVSSTGGEAKTKAASQEGKITSNTNKTTLTMTLVSDTGVSATDRIILNSAIKGTGQPNRVVTIKEGDTTGFTHELGG